MSIVIPETLKKWKIWKMLSFFSVRVSIVLGIFLFGIVAAAVINRFTNVFLFSIFLALALTVAVCSSCFLLFAKISNWKALSVSESVYLSLIGNLIIFATLSSFPLNIDRSFSVWTLNYISKEESSGLEMSVQDLELALAENFSAQSGELSRRVNEQILVGNLAVSEERKISLTNQGRNSRQFFKFISVFFDLNPKYAQ